LKRKILSGSSANYKIMSILEDLNYIQRKTIYGYVYQKDKTVIVNEFNIKII